MLAMSLNSINMCFYNVGTNAYSTLLHVGINWTMNYIDFCGNHFCIFIVSFILLVFLFIILCLSSVANKHVTH